MKQNEKIININKILKPLFKKEVALIYLYGSFCKKKEYNDIDVLIVINDLEFNNFPLSDIERKIKEIQISNNLKIHFQPVKFLSSWWGAIIKGEPWIMNSIKDSIVIWDEEKIIEGIKRLIIEEKTYNIEEKIEELVENSNNFEIQNRDILLETIISISNIATEIIQIYFLSKGKVIINKKAIISELEKENKKFSDIYTEITDLESKVERGFLNEFTCSNLDFYLQKINLFIKEIEKKIK